MTTLMIAEVEGAIRQGLIIESGILAAVVTIQRFVYEGDDQALIDACQKADCILTDYVPFTEPVISQLKNCQLISVSATGYACIDIEAAAAAGISVCAIDEYCTDEVADHTLLLILALARKLTEYHHLVQQQHRWQFDALSGLARLRGKTLGIIGFGRIGRAVATRAIAFGMKCMAFDPFVTEPGPGEVPICTLNDILENADIITLHCALTTTNHHLLNQRAFQSMDKQPMLINVARGGLIDENALIEALDSKLISAAALDVLESESPHLASSGLLGRDNVILTPHTAFYSDASIVDNRVISAQNILHHLEGNHAQVRRYIHQAHGEQARKTMNKSTQSARKS